MYSLSYPLVKPLCCEKLLGKGSLVAKFGYKLLTNAGGSHCYIHTGSSPRRASFLRLLLRLKEASGTDWTLLGSLPHVSAF